MAPGDTLRVEGYCPNADLTRGGNQWTVHGRDAVGTLTANASTLSANDRTSA
jgi:hypothetical protein